MAVTVADGAAPSEMKCIAMDAFLAIVNKNSLAIDWHLLPVSVVVEVIFICHKKYQPCTEYLLTTIHCKLRRDERTYTQCDVALNSNMENIYNCSLQNSVNRQYF